MIETNDVRKQFGAVQALGGVSFTARDGQITALLGPNGAGKTTLLRLLVGLLKRDHGSISIDGVDPERDPMAVRRNIGFLTDQFGLYDRLSTREYLVYFGELNGMAGAHAARAHRRGGRPAGDERHPRTARQGLLAGPAHQGGAGAHLAAPPAPPAARRTEPRPRRDEHARAAHRPDRAARGRLLRDHGHPRDAGSDPPVRRRDRHRQGPHGGAGLARSNCAERTGIANLEDAFVSLVGTEEGIVA